MQISLHRTRNTKQVMRGHNIVGDGWVGAASHHPNSRTTLEMLDNLSKTLKLPQYLATSGQLSQCKNHWNILQEYYRASCTATEQILDNLRITLRQFLDKSRTTPERIRLPLGQLKKLKDNSDNFRTTPWTFLRQLGQLQDNKNNSSTTLRELQNNFWTTLGHF